MNRSSRLREFVTWLVLLVGKTANSAGGFFLIFGNFEHHVGKQADPLEVDRTTRDDFDALRVLARAMRMKTEIAYVTDDVATDWKLEAQIAVTFFVDLVYRLRRARAFSYISRFSL